MEWSYGKSLPGKTWIDKIEAEIVYRYPEQFVKLVLEHDGASPETDEFDTQETEGRVFEYLLSFDPNSELSVWDYLDEGEWSIEGLEWQYIPFATDPFGNYICFDRTNNHVVFWDHEIAEVEEVADTFTEFIDSLYESED